MSRPADTIAAPATAAGRAAVAVIRLSGPATRAILETLASPLPPPRRASLRKLRAPSGEILDHALVLWFPSPASFTGEDAGELHLHGGPGVQAAVLAALFALGARPARPGEFTRRAFHQGKLDLTQAEAIADLVDAETDGQRAQALRQLDGGLGAFYETLRSRLLDAAALIEAEIDFPDEDDIPAAVASRAAPILAQVRAELAAHLADAHRGARVREGYRIALIGEPNAGKSTLLNTLAGRDAAIVTDIPGTTRDVIEARVVIAGHAVHLLDTAGLRETDDPVEREGVRRARAAAAEADLRILVVDESDPPAPTIETPANLLKPGDLVWRNKLDLARGTLPTDNEAADLTVLTGSLLTGAGVDALRTGLEARIAADLAPREAPSLTRARHRDACRRAEAALARAEAMLTRAPELAGEDVRLAMAALGEITGRVDVEEVLDRIFASFCLGK